MARDVAATVLLIAGVAVQLLSVSGVVLVRDTLDRVHFLAPSTLATLCVAAAIVVKEALSSIGITALLLAAFMLVTGPVLTHVTGHAIHRARREDR